MRRAALVAANMLQVQVHRIQSSPSSFLLSFLFLVTFFLSISVLPADAQGFLQNGQFFTAGLAISDAPFPGRYVVRSIGVPNAFRTLFAARSMQGAI